MKAKMHEAHPTHSGMTRCGRSLRPMFASDNPDEVTCGACITRRDVFDRFLRREERDDEREALASDVAIAAVSHAVHDWLNRLSDVDLQAVVDTPSRLTSTNCSWVSAALAPVLADLAASKLRFNELSKANAR